MSALVLAGIGAWASVLAFALALCKSSARGDRAAKRALELRITHVRPELQNSSEPERTEIMRERER